MLPDGRRGVGRKSHAPGSDCGALIPAEHRRLREETYCVARSPCHLPRAVRQVTRWCEACCYPFVIWCTKRESEEPLCAKSLVDFVPHHVDTRVAAHVSPRAFVMSHVMAIEVPKSVAWSDHGPATCWRFAQTASTSVWYVCYSEYDVVSFARRRLELT